MSITKDQIIEAVASMSVMDVVELITAMEEKFGVSAAAPMMMAAAGGAAAAEHRHRAAAVLLVRRPPRLRLRRRARDFERLEDDVSFDLGHGRAGDANRPMRRRRSLERQVARCDLGALGEHDRTLDDVLEFADVARPGVRAEQGHRILGESGDLLAVLLVELLDLGCCCRTLQVVAHRGCLAVVAF